MVHHYLLLDRMICNDGNEKKCNKIHHKKFIFSSVTVRERKDIKLVTSDELSDSKEIKRTQKKKKRKEKKRKKKREVGK